MFSQYKDTIALTVICSLVLLVGYLAYTKARLETRYAEAQAMIVSLSDANSDWVEKANMANKALEAYAKQAKAREEAALKEVDRARKEAADYNQKANELLKAKPKGDVCVAAKRLIDGYIGGRK